MSRFSNSLVALSGLSLLVVALAALLPREGTASDEKKGPPQFYVTKTEHKGNEVLSACAAGYHMASLWEIIDPSNLRYNTELGFTHVVPDSGFGPPSGHFGWIRTGFSASEGGSSGQANCLAWTSGETSHEGTIVTLPAEWDSTGSSRTDPWSKVKAHCDFTLPVWCVQD